MKTAFQLLQEVYDSDGVQTLRQQGKLNRFFDKVWEQEEDLDFSKADFRKLDFQGDTVDRMPVFIRRTIARSESMGGHVFKEQI